MLRERGVHIKQRWSLPASRHQFPVLAALGCWNFALGSFNPFVTVFLSKHLGAPIAGLGSLVSVLQVLQALAVLSSPWILRRLALGTGIMTTQLFAAGSLVVLSLSPTWLWASIPLTGYLLAQHMSEPGVQTWLMDSADETQRSGLSAVYLLVVSGCQAVAAAVAGSVTARFGYKPMMVGAACIAVFAAVLFRFSCSSPGAQSYGPAPVEQTTLGAGNSSGAITRP
jgi:predicted MFS family arabinose efflux permease